MLERNQILPVGSLITIRHETDKGKETVCVVVGHLTLRREIISRFDYTCVKFPQGVEDGLIYVNHDDIVNIIYRASDYDELNETWMNRKYAEYVAYYKHYGEYQRPDIDKIFTRLIHLLGASVLLPKQQFYYYLSAVPRYCLSYREHG